MLKFLEWFNEKTAACLQGCQGAAVGGLIAGAGGKHKESARTHNQPPTPLHDLRWNFGREKCIMAIMGATHQTLDALTLQLLTWVAAKPRTYAEAMGAWRTSCPRMPIWEDAIGDGLIRLENGGAMRDALVVLTDRGRAALTDASAPAEAPVRRVGHRILHEA